MHPCPLRNSQLMSTRGFVNRTTSLLMCLHVPMANQGCSMIRHILPEQRPLGTLSPRRSPPSFLGNLSSVRLCRRMGDRNIHCRKLEPRQHRHYVTPALALHRALPSGQGPVYLYL